MLLSELVDASEAVRSTRSRTAKVAAVAAALGAARGDAEQVRIASAYLSGALRQRRTGLGWRSLTDLPPAATAQTLALTDVDAAFARIAAETGDGSQARRTASVTSLFARATAAEQRFLRALVTGELRQGALDGVMLDAVAIAGDVSAGAVRRAAMLSGSTQEAAVAALTGGEPGLAAIGLEVGRPLRPMLASSAP
ncbi:MAG: ATP-dependent DNA ligase, partial [Nocardioidaceae bacterium]